MRKTDLYRILFLVGFWEFAVLFNVFFESAMLGFMPSSDSPPGAVFDFGARLGGALLVGALFSAVIAIVEVLYFSKLLRRWPFGTALLIKTGFYLANMIVAISLAVLIVGSNELGKPILDRAVWTLYATYVTGGRMLATILYWAMAVGLALFLLQISQKFGQGVLLNFLIGRYHHPKEEVRIFMFLDLTSSTTYAERLGHLKYSQLIQDCFFDLSEVVTHHKAEVYQYVGDEVVLTWKEREGRENYNCLALFFGYDRALQEKRDHYQEKYGVVPEFKAGVNVGHVTVAEVGEIKTELAYHGDALNTAARIRSLCRAAKRRLLVSEALTVILTGVEEVFRVESIGGAHLKGKKGRVNLLSVEAR